MRAAPPIRPSGLAGRGPSDRRASAQPGGAAGGGPTPTAPPNAPPPAASSAGPSVARRAAPATSSSPLAGLRPPAAPAAPGPSTAPVVAMDPRISARRIAVRRQEGRRRLRRLTWLAGVVGVVVALAAVTRTPLLDVDTVTVEGATRLTTEQVHAALAAAGLHRGDPLLDVDLGDARRALEALPGVTEADLRRRWPGTVEVSLVERLPVAAVAGAAGVALVGLDGVVVEVVTSPAAVAAAEVVTVAGPTDLAVGHRYDAPDLLAVAAALPEQLRPLVAVVGPAAEDGAVDLHLAAGGVVRLGTEDLLPAKLVAATTMLTQVDTTCLAVLDVRVPSVPAVTRDPGC